MRGTRFVAIILGTAFVVLLGGAQAADGPVAHWELDDGSGDTATDSVGSNHGTLMPAFPSNAPQWVGGRVGAGALDFDGLDDYVSVPMAIADFSGAFTVSLWAKLDSISMWDPLIGVTQDDGNYAFVLCLENGLKLYTKLDWGLDWTTTHSAPIETGVWYHFVVVLDAGSNSTVYVNGVGYPSGWVTRRNNRGTLHIGRMANAPIWTEAIDGLIDEVRIYDRALSPAEVDALYVAGFAPEPPVIVTPSEGPPEDPAESPVSPAWVEGTVVPGATSVTVSVDSGASFDATLMDRTHWFADNASVGGAPLGIVLSECDDTTVEVTAGFDGVEMTASRTITWAVTDISGMHWSSNTITIRKGDSLLLTASDGNKIDADGNGTFELYGGLGAEYPVMYDAPDEVIVTAHHGSNFVGSLLVIVVDVDLTSPIACQVGYQREKDIAITPPAYASQVSFAAAEPHLLDVSVKELTATGATLYLKPHHRGTPVLVARLGGEAGPIITTKEIDEFTLDVPARVGTLVNDETDAGKSPLTMRPYVADVTLEFDMFASQSTFLGGATNFTVNTSDAESSLGEPGFQPVWDDETGETVGQFLFTLEVPDTEPTYSCCMNITVRQLGSDEEVIAREDLVNGRVCKARVDVLALCTDGDEGDLHIHVTKCEYYAGPLPITIETATNGPLFKNNPPGTPSATRAVPDLTCSVGLHKRRVISGSATGTFDVKIGIATFKDKIHVSDGVKMRLRFTGNTTPDNPTGLSMNWGNNKTLASGVTALGVDQPQRPSINGHPGFQNLMEIVGIMCTDNPPLAGWGFVCREKYKIYQFQLDGTLETVETVDRTASVPLERTDPFPNVRDPADNKYKIFAFDHPRVFVDTAKAKAGDNGTVRAERLTGEYWITKDGQPATPPQSFHANITIRKITGGQNQVGTWKRVGPSGYNEIGAGAGTDAFSAAEGVIARDFPLE